MHARMASEPTATLPLRQPDDLALCGAAMCQMAWMGWVAPPLRQSPNRRSAAATRFTVGMHLLRCWLRATCAGLRIRLGSCLSGPRRLVLRRFGRSLPADLHAAFLIQY